MNSHPLNPNRLLNTSMKKPSITEIINNVHLSKETSIGSAHGQRGPSSPLAPSINLSSANEFSTLEALGSAHSNRFDSVRYARDTSELIIQTERYISAIHNNSHACLFQSGMAALDAALTTGAHDTRAIAVIGSAYRKSLNLIKLKASERSIEFIQASSIDHLRQCSRSLGQKILIFIETPSNPFLRLQDVGRIKSLFPEAFIIADITLQGLANDKINLETIADIVVSSCTKYAGGHNDLIAGYAVTRKLEQFQSLWEFRSMRGCILDNLSAYLLIRSLRTYDIRIDRQLSNASGVLKYLAESQKVSHTYYPGMHENANQHSLFKCVQHDGGSVVTFRLAQSVDATKTINSLLSTKMAPSFGSIDTLIEIPALMSHWGKSPEELEAIGLDNNIIRLSIGLEPLHFILSDLNLLLQE